MDRRTFVTLTSTGLLCLPVLARATETPVKLRDLYDKDLSFSDLARLLEGERITVSGFMAPPLKAESKFFVLTKMPMATCPFCESAADWPDDILAVYTQRILRPTPFNVGIDTRGVLQLGAMTDPETGFVSRVRLVDAVLS